MSKIDITSFPLFSTPVSVCNFGRDARDLNNRLYRDIMHEYVKVPINTRSVVNGWQSNGGLEKEYESFAELSESIDAAIRSLIPNHGFPPDQMHHFKMGDLWANVLEVRGSFNMPHIHGTGETVFSGVYYPTSGKVSPSEEDYYDENYATVQIRASSHPQSGDLVLFDPAADIKRQTIPGFVQRHPYYGQEICIEPKESHLIIFPNYLKHMVAPITLSNFRRVSISFAFTKKG